MGYHIAQGDAEHFTAARAAGGNFVVIVLSWADIDPERNHLYWEVPDATLRAAEFYGLEVVARIDRPPEWAFDGTNPSPWKLDAYARFTQSVAARYGDRLAGVIIWNEPNLSLEWNGRPPVPEGYVQMLRPAYRAIKQVAPELPVLAAGLALTTANDETALDDLDFLRGIYEFGGGQFFDILAAHPYGFGRPPQAAPAPDRLNFRRLELYREIMAANGDADKPIWITEMGWRTAAPNPDDAWQVVTPRQQRTYTLDAIDYAAENWPWLEKMALWELNAQEDIYGYDLWHGPDDVSLAYRALAANCRDYNPACRTDPARRPANDPPSFPKRPALTRPQAPTPLPILAPDAIIRLGDRGTLHPHWVHLYRGGERFSPDWRGEFFLTRQQVEQEYDLLLEMMQVDQPTNRLRLNDTTLPNLQPRPRPDPTSTWVTQRITIPADTLRPGRNVIEIASGPRNPAWQYSFWRWENFQFRNIRLVESEPLPDPILTDWRPRPAPGGWSETNRLRSGPTANQFWLTGNRAGEIWRGTISGRGVATLQPQAANQASATFVDIAATEGQQVAATAEGLLWRMRGRTVWQPVEGAPAAHSYVVVERKGRFYAGFEENGLWSAAQAEGPWQQTDFPAELTVLDIAFGPQETIYVASDDGVYTKQAGGETWRRLPNLPGDNQGQAGNPLKRFITRLYLSKQGELVVRNLDQLWRYTAADEGEAAWQAFGPPELHEDNKLLSVTNCCQAGTLVGTNNFGLWQLDEAGAWQRVDDDFLDRAAITGLLALEGRLYAAGMVTLLESVDEGQSWQPVAGLPPVISDLLIDPAAPNRWLAATGSGLHRSEDGGQTWAAISPPWTVWDVAFGADGRFFVARTEGVAWTDDLSEETIRWQETDGLEDVLFFSVNPHPRNGDILLGGTWGNNLGVSYDGGQDMESIHNGLEALSVLDVWQHPIEGQLTVGTIEGLYRTDDRGQSWFKLPGALKRQTVYALWQTDDSTIWAGAADGLWFSRDYGVEWQRVAAVPPATILRLGQIEGQDQTWLWAGTEGAGLWLSQDQGQSWQFGGLAETTVYQLLADPRRPAIWVAATDRGLLETFRPNGQ